MVSKNGGTMSFLHDETKIYGPLLKSDNVDFNHMQICITNLKLWSTEANK